MDIQQREQGFTLVELLIVIIVISIIAAITIVAYSGVQDSAKNARIMSELDTAASTTLLKLASVNSLPSASELEGSGIFTMNISGDTSTGVFCITAYADGYRTKSVNQNKVYKDEPCDGHSGGPEYCPNNSYVIINGYYCEGATGSSAAYQSGATKLLASDSTVPTGAPGFYVGRQTSRDITGTTDFTVTAGEVFCATGWATTVSSTVNHRIGIQFMGSYGSSWQGALFPVAESTNVWKKASACFTAPSGTTSARFWTQNDGTNGGTASPAWYQTAMTLTKQ